MTNQQSDIMRPRPSPSIGLALIACAALVGCEGQPLDANPAVSLPAAINSPSLPPPLSFPTVTFVVNTTSDTDDGVCDATHCSLREAIRLGNAVSNFLVTRLVSITFNVPPVLRIDCQPFPVGCVSRPFLPPIVVTSSLPAISRTMSIDGTTQPNFAGKPLLELRGPGATSNVIGLRLVANTIGIGSVIRGLSITGFQVGITLGSNGNLVTGNLIGLEPGGAVRANTDGLRVQGDENHIGGATSSERNVISGNAGAGVVVCSSCGVEGAADAFPSKNQLQGNFIGTDISGVSARGNRTGVLVRGTQTTVAGLGTFFQGPARTLIGGPTRAHGNVISGNLDNGIDLQLGPDQTRVGGNLVGLDASGRTAVPNGRSGIATSQALETVLGVLTENGVTVTGGNFISGNLGAGVNLAELAFGSTHAGLFGNLIGLDSTGTVGVPNQGDGIHTSISAQIGDVDLGNTIAFNQGAGVSTTGPSNVRFNRIFSNGGLGFDDGGNGPDELVHFPGLLPRPHITVSSAHNVGGVTHVEGFFDFGGESSGTSAIDFYASPSCDQSGFGEGASFIGTKTIIATAEQSSGSFSIDLPTVSLGQVLTATRTFLFTDAPRGATQDDFTRCVTVQ
jgi:CSLREA domain-containing protein